ncbi:MAG: septum formation initiator family protein [bacterium]|nr:septum formation initiator family protein [bacterium]
MNDTKERDGFVKKIARYFKHNLTVVLVSVFFICLISMAVFGNKGILQRFNLENEKKDLEEQLRSELKKTQDLRKEIEDIRTSDEKMEEIAREKYGMTKEGEKIYKVTVDSTK